MCFCLEKVSDISYANLAGIYTGLPGLAADEVSFHVALSEIMRHVVVAMMSCRQCLFLIANVNCVIASSGGARIFVV